MNIAAAAVSRAPAIRQPIRVMVVDDAVVARSLVARWVDAEPDMALAASLRTGRQAVEQIEISDPDVVVLDVEMPDLDGISALPLLLRKKRDLAVIMASSVTRRAAEISLRALTLGAADYVPKPLTTGEAAGAEFRRELIDKIRHFGSRRRGATARAVPAPLPVADARHVGDARNVADAPPHRGDAPERLALVLPPGPAIALRPFSVALPRVLLIGSSTGGPQALTTLMKGLGDLNDRVPVLVTQHMPPTFTTVLAEHLARASGRRVREAEHGEAIAPGVILLAPGGCHMRIAGSREQPTVALGDDPPINFCRPAVDPLFASGAAMWGPATLALVLTGMGTDGARGAAELIAAGGSIIAQDETTSVVWGMPRAVAQAGLCAAVLPIEDIAAKIVRVFAGDRS